MSKNFCYQSTWKAFFIKILRKWLLKKFILNSGRDIIHSKYMKHLVTKSISLKIYNINWSYIISLLAYKALQEEWKSFVCLLLFYLVFSPWVLAKLPVCSTSIDLNKCSLFCFKEEIESNIFLSMPLKSTKYARIVRGKCFTSYYTDKRDKNEFLFHRYIHYKPIITYFH